MDSYYIRPEVSNSDLSNLKKQLYGYDDEYDPTDAYAFGNLIDYMLTEPHKVDYFNLKVDGMFYEFTKEQFDTAIEMRRAFVKDELAMSMLRASEMQKVMIEKDKQFEYQHIRYNLSVRCKWDLFMTKFGWGGDIKSTTATTQSQFEEACRYFDYDRQRWWYMNIAGSNQDILIGISKVNQKVFKLPIKRGDDFWKSGKDKALDLSFKYWTMFGNVA